MPRYHVIKRYGHEQGLSCVFRQWRAESHCRFLHGYALAFTFHFSCDQLDPNGWVVDFGSLKPLKEWLVKHFDHKLLVAKGDPDIQYLFELKDRRLADVIILEAVGCEAFACIALQHANKMLKGMTPFEGLPYEDTVKRAVVCPRVEVSEHAGNTAVYEIED